MYIVWRHFATRLICFYQSWHSICLHLSFIRQFTNSSNSGHRFFHSFDNLHSGCPRQICHIYPSSPFPGWRSSPSICFFDAETVDMFFYSFKHSIIHSYIHLFIHAFNNTFAHSFIFCAYNNTIICLFTHSITHSYIHLLIYSFNNTFIGYIYLFIHSFNNTSIHLFVHSGK